MKKISFGLLMVGLAIISTGIVFAGNITVTGVNIYDAMGNARTSFSSNERITLSISIYNSVAVPNINYKFYILDSSGRQLMLHDGNSSIGKVGEGASQLKNITLGTFYQTPGNYTFKGEAIAGVDSDYKTISFYVYSPYITLLYPMNGVRDLTDKPLQFKWNSSGASRYRITLADNAGFFNPIWTTETTGTEISYLLSPTGRQILISGTTVYYWKMEGLDASGNVISTCPTPYNFTIKKEMRDVGIKDENYWQISYIENAEGMMNLIVPIQNNGTQAEANVLVRCKVNLDEVPTSPKTISYLSPGQIEKVEFNFSANPGQNLIVVDLLNWNDDDPNNNQKLKYYTPTFDISLTDIAVIDLKSFTPIQPTEGIYTIFDNEIGISVYVKSYGSLPKISQPLLLWFSVNNIKERVDEGEYLNPKSYQPIPKGAQAVFRDKLPEGFVEGMRNYEISLTVLTGDSSEGNNKRARQIFVRNGNIPDVAVVPPPIFYVGQRGEIKIKIKSVNGVDEVKIFFSGLPEEDMTLVSGDIYNGEWAYTPSFVKTGTVNFYVQVKDKKGYQKETVKSQISVQEVPLPKISSLLYEPIVYKNEEWKVQANVESIQEITEVEITLNIWKAEANQPEVIKGKMEKDSSGSYKYSFKFDQSVDVGFWVKALDSNNNYSLPAKGYFQVWEKGGFDLSLGDKIILAIGDNVLSPDNEGNYQILNKEVKVNFYVAVPQNLPQQFKGARRTVEYNIGEWKGTTNVRLSLGSAFGNFNWKPKSQGKYHIKINLPPIRGEDDITNNIFEKDIFVK